MNDSHGNKHLYDKRFVEKRHYEVKSLWQNHEQMLRMVALGCSNEQVAQACGVTAQTVSNVRNSPVAQGKLLQLRSSLDAEAIDIGAKINEFAPVALKLLEEVISGQIDAPIAIRAKYASIHLARAGFGEVKKIASVNTHLTRDDIEVIKQRALSAAIDANLIVSDD
jgi:transcriptional regulator with XRE-family HTH domain